MAIITVILSLFLSFTMAENIENNLLLGTKDEGAAHSMPNSHVDCPEGTENIDNFPGYDDPICVPLLFSSVIQSSQQAFYYFVSVEINESSIDDDDWVGAFKDETCVGAHQWDTSACSNEVCSVPVMGYISIVPETENYMEPGDIPFFKIYDTSEKKYFDTITSEDIDSWNNYGMPIINTLSATCGSAFEIDECGVCGGNGIPEGDCDCDGNVIDECGVCGGNGILEGESSCLSIHQLMIPSNYKILNVYPNPFNPKTMIEYDLPINTNVLILVYDIHGKQVELLINQFQTAGQHFINWNASSYSSGIYFIRMEIGILPQIHKVVLIK